MRDILRLTKVIVPLLSIAAITCMIFAWFGINLRIHTVFGHALLLDLMLLFITYTRAGKKYFTNSFRYLIYLLITISLTEMANTIFIFDVYVYYNIALSIPLISLAMLITSKIIQNDKRDKDVTSSIR